MGTPCSRPRYTYVLPTDSFLRCTGAPATCLCIAPHAGSPRLVFDPSPGHCGPRRRRYIDPLQFVDRLAAPAVQNQVNFPGSGDVNVGVAGYGNGVGVGAGGGLVGPGAGFGALAPGLPFGGFGGLGWKDPRDWTTRDFECLREVFAEMLARRRGRRGGPARYRDEPLFDDWDGDVYDGGVRGRDLQRLRDMILQLGGAHDRLRDTVLGRPEERREAAFRARLYDVLGGDDGERGGGGGAGLRGANTCARFMQQQRDHERREREQRNLDREVDEIRRHLERLQDQGERVGGAAGPGGWRLVDEWPF